MKISYNYCGICGYIPHGDMDEPNYAPVRWWDCDDGWKIGTLCAFCRKEVEGVKPKQGDFAFCNTNGVCDDLNTDEDPTEIFG